MSPHPYRQPRQPSPSLAPDGPDATAQRAAAFEERCLAIVLLVAGVLGLAIGLRAPRTEPLELVLGTMLCWLSVRTLRSRSSLR